jgi:hypothetical protein
MFGLDNRLTNVQSPESALVGFGVGVVFDLGVGRVRLDRLNALLSACLRLVLASGDDLTVGCLEVESKLAGVVFADLELCGHHILRGASCQD